MYIRRNVQIQTTLKNRHLKGQNLNFASFAHRTLSMEIDVAHAPPELEEISQESLEKAERFKSSLIDYYRELLVFLRDKRKRRKQFNRFVKQHHLQGNDLQKYKREFLAKELTFLRLRRTHTTASDFRWIALLGAGSFAQVFLCRHISTSTLVAMKRISLDSYSNSDKIFRLRTERAVLGALNNDWLIRLYYAFQDSKYLYLAMEYAPGGDFGNLLQNVGYLDEQVTCHYLAQMICCIHTLHLAGYIHRDVKPSNFLFGADGLLRLGDFGLSKGDPESLPAGCDDTSEFDVGGTRPTSAVSDSLGLSFLQEGEQVKLFGETFLGTPDYMAIEMTRNEGYDETVDWWSVGCIMYEMLSGHPPFHSINDEAVMSSVKDYRQTLVRPKDISDDAWNMITHLICEPEDRLGRNGISDFIHHPLFLKHNISFRTLRQVQPPFIPTLASDVDLTYFDTAIPIDLSILRSSSGVGFEAVQTNEIPETSVFGFSNPFDVHGLLIDVPKVGREVIDDCDTESNSLVPVSRQSDDDILFDRPTPSSRTRSNSMDSVSSLDTVIIHSDLPIESTTPSILSSSFDISTPLSLTNSYQPFSEPITPSIGNPFAESTAASFYNTPIMQSTRLSRVASISQTVVSPSYTNILTTPPPLSNPPQYPAFTQTFIGASFQPVNANPFETVETPQAQLSNSFSTLPVEESAVFTFHTKHSTRPVTAIHSSSSSHSLHASQSTSQLPNPSLFAADLISSRILEHTQEDSDRVRRRPTITDIIASELGGSKTERRIQEYNIQQGWNGTQLRDDSSLSSSQSDPSPDSSWMIRTADSEIIHLEIKPIKRGSQPHSNPWKKKGTRRYEGAEFGEDSSDGEMDSFHQTFEENPRQTVHNDIPAELDRMIQAQQKEMNDRLARQWMGMLPSANYHKQKESEFVMPTLPQASLTETTGTFQHEGEDELEHEGMLTDRDGSPLQPPKSVFTNSTNSSPILPPALPSGSTSSTSQPTSPDSPNQIGLNPLRTHVHSEPHSGFFYTYSSTAQSISVKGREIKANERQDSRLKRLKQTKRESPHSSLNYSPNHSPQGNVVLNESPPLARKTRHMSPGITSSLHTSPKLVPTPAHTPLFTSPFMSVSSIVPQGGALQRDEGASGHLPKLEDRHRRDSDEDKERETKEKERETKEKEKLKIKQQKRRNAHEHRRVNSNPRTIWKKEDAEPPRQQMASAHSAPLIFSSQPQSTSSFKRSDADVDKPDAAEAVTELGPKLFSEGKSGPVIVTYPSRLPPLH
ncbi:putative serine/threonine protein kinase [Blattamonas nauphoetae]|uniref:non-specific serine/threonine protein kinase n=1 Tax=Blattamonas nauphoetae TaxID=2049346 RepID=A0ABQ9XRP0_9EUKA|nr:putative serine/threonine protein kinase [Blattamonas nauphoetae]